MTKNLPQQEFFLLLFRKDGGGIFGKKRGAIVVLTFFTADMAILCAQGRQWALQKFQKSLSFGHRKFEADTEKKDFSEFLLREKKRRYIFTAEKAITKSSSFLSLGEKTRDFPEKATRKKKIGPERK